MLPFITHSTQHPKLNIHWDQYIPHQAEDLYTQPKHFVYRVIHTNYIHMLLINAPGIYPVNAYVLGRTSIKKLDFLGATKRKVHFLSFFINILLEPVLRLLGMTIQTNYFNVFRACWMFFTFCLKTIDFYLAGGGSNPPPPPPARGTCPLNVEFYLHPPLLLLLQNLFLHLISHKRYLKCTLVQRRLSIYP